MGREYKALIVPFQAANGVELAPGAVFYVSGAGQPALFIRIIESKGGIMGYNSMDADGRFTTVMTSPSGFQERLPGAMLKYQTIMSDSEWEAFGDLLGLISRYGLERGQFWKLFLCFQNMDIERQMAMMSHEKDDGGDGD